MRGIAILACVALMACGGEVYRDNAVEMQVADGFEVEPYLGKWYEIARYPNWFERDCFATTAEYSALESGEVEVKNTCRTGSVDGAPKQSIGKARLIAPGKLQVTFAPFYLPGGANYWVLDQLDGEISVVGTPSGKTGWILARSPEISPEALDWAKNVLARNGYALEGLMMVEQP